MDIKILEHGDGRTHMIRLEANEAIMTSLSRVLREREIIAGTVRARGRLSRLTVMRPPAGDATTVPCPADIVLLEGDIVLEGDAPSVVAQVIVMQPDGTVTGGRIAEATADACEVTLVEHPSYPRRRLDPATGAAFVDLAAGQSPVGGKPAGEVEEASDESFPASDPPSFAGVPASDGSR